MEKEANKKKWYAINTKLLAGKCCYFVSGFKAAAIFPFYTLFLLGAGLQPQEAGLVNSMFSLGTLTGSIVWGLIADTKQCHRAVLVVVVIAATAATLPQPFVATRFADTQCLITESLSMDIARNSSHTKSISNSPKDKRVVYIFATFSFLVSFFNSGINPLIDSGVLKKLEQVGEGTYGRQRIFFALGFCSSSIVTNLLIGEFRSTIYSCYTVCFIAATVTNIILLLTSSVLYSGIKLKQKKEMKVSYLGELKKVMLRYRTLVFLCYILVQGFSLGILISYLMPYLELLNTSNLLKGLVLSLGSISAITAYYVSGFVMRTLNGHWNVALLSGIACCLRYISFYFTRSPYLVMALQLIYHGATLPLCLTTITEFVRTEVPASLYSTMFCVCQSTLFGVGMVLANVVGGYIHQSYGIIEIFKFTCIVNAMWTLLLGVNIAVWNRKSKQKQDVIDKPDEEAVLV